MNFPRIDHIDDVLPFIPADKGIIVSRRGDHTVIDYVFTTDDTFDTAMARECRGLKFDAEGRIIGRPFHKFFNLGERERAEDIDWSAPHAVLDKLDGSMVHPVLLGGRMLFMTRMGAKPQAAAAERHADAGILDLSRLLLAEGVTPLFEFTAPDNRIVLAYDTPRLTLLAARAMTSGAHWPHAELEKLGARFGVPVVADSGAIGDAADFVRRARQAQGIEGYVLAFDSGHRIKLKADGYVLRHKALSGLAFEKNVLAWVVANAVDDVVPLLSPDHAARVLAYQDTVNAGISRQAEAISAFVAANRGLPRKDFAMKTLAEVDKRLKSAVFSTLDGKDPRAVVVELVAEAARSDPRVDAIRDLIGMEWAAGDLDLPDLAS